MRAPPVPPIRFESHQSGLHIACSFSTTNMPVPKVWHWHNARLVTWLRFVYRGCQLATHSEGSERLTRAPTLWEYLSTGGGAGGGSTDTLLYKSSCQEITNSPALNYFYCNTDFLRLKVQSLRLYPWKPPWNTRYGLEHRGGGLEVIDFFLCGEGGDKYTVFSAPVGCKR